MRLRADMRRIGSLLALLAGLGWSLHRVDEYRYRPYLHANLYLPSGRFLKEISLGYEQLAADMVWLSAVQYYGEYRMGDHDLAYFRALIDIVTSLDPNFTFAYIFGALVTCEDLETFDEGIDILRKGMAWNPTAWQLPFEIGFLYYIERADYDMAAHYFDLASRLPGSSALARRFAAFVYSRAGHIENSIRMWEEMKRTAEDPFMRELAARYLQKLRAKQAGNQERIDVGI